MPKYGIAARAIVLLTKEFTIEADDHADAEIRAKQLMFMHGTKLGWWDISEPEDQLIDSVWPETEGEV